MNAPPVPSVWVVQQNWKLLDKNIVTVAVDRVYLTTEFRAQRGLNMCPFREMPVSRILTADRVDFWPAPQVPNRWHVFLTNTLLLEANNDNRAVQQVFEDIGLAVTHLHITQNALIVSFCVYEEKETAPNVRSYVFEVRNMAPVHHILPNLCYRKDPNREGRLFYVGLKFNINQNAAGNRVGRTGRIDRGGVDEITHQDLQAMWGNAGPMSAIYVEEGVRLFIVDPYGVRAGDHNHTLLLGGGVLVMEGYRLDFQFSTDNYRFLSIEQFNQCLDEPLNLNTPEFRKGFVCYLNPLQGVTSMWAFRLSHARAGCLSIPQGGSFEAILPWSDGVFEACVRIAHKRPFRQHLEVHHINLNLPQYNNVQINEIERRLITDRQKFIADFRGASAQMPLYLAIPPQHPNQPFPYQAGFHFRDIGPALQPRLSMRRYERGVALPVMFRRMTGGVSVSAFPTALRDHEYALIYGLAHEIHRPSKRYNLIQWLPENFDSNQMDIRPESGIEYCVYNTTAGEQWVPMFTSAGQQSGV